MHTRNASSFLDICDTMSLQKRKKSIFFFLLALGLRIDVNNPQGPFYVGQGLFQECPSQRPLFRYEFQVPAFICYCTCLCQQSCWKHT